MKLFLPLLLLAAPALAQEISSPVTFVRQPFDVVHYDAELDLTEAPSRRMRGVCTIALDWVPGVEGPKYFAFHLRSLAIERATWNGVPVDVTTVGDPASATYHHRIAAPVAPAAGERTLVRIEYAGTMTDELGPAGWGGVGEGDSTVFGIGVGLSNNYVSTTQHWLPCYDHPSDKATFHGRFKTLDRFVTASNGVVTTSRAGDTTVSEWTTALPTATYLLTFATSDYVRLDLGSDPVPMVAYSRPRDTAATLETFRLLPRMVRAFSARFVPYPFEKVGYVNTPRGAMEHQTMIAFPTSISASRDTVNPYGAHELAHQWFGDLVTPRDYRHVWLTEAFATFSESLWLEELFGTGRYLRSLGEKLGRYTGSIASAEGLLPLHDFPRERPSSNYPETIYQKGAVVVGMLRTRLGDDAFFAMLREYLTTHAYGVATTEEFRAIAERHAGEPLDWFFDQWVYGKGWPVIAARVAKTPTGNGMNRVVVELDQTPHGDDRVYRRLPIELAFIGGGDTSARIVELDAASGTFTLEDVPDFSTVGINRGQTLRTLLRVGAVSGVESFIANADSAAVSFQVRPNPTDGSSALNVRVLGVDECAGVAYELYDSSGRRMGVGTSDLCEFTIPTEGIASGAYVLRFRFRDIFHDVSIVVAR